MDSSTYNNRRIQKLALIGAAFLCLLTTSIASAAIHACKLPDGSVTFQDNACTVAPKTPAKKVKLADSIPFSIEKSWFDKPSVVPDRAICTKAGCHCGMFSRKFEDGLALAIADSLYLDGSWHRLEGTLVELELDQSNTDPFAVRDLMMERDEAACNILMSQKILQLYGEETLAALRKKRRYAEEHGLDNVADCDAGNLLVCDYTDQIGIFNRIQSDIRSLQNISRLDDEDSVLETAESLNQ